MGVGWSIAKAGGKVAIKAKSKKAVTVKRGKSIAASKYAKVTKNSPKGTITYVKVKGNKNITVAENGRITVGKGLKKGKTYSIKVRAISTSANYIAMSNVITVKIKVK